MLIATGCTNNLAASKFEELDKKVIELEKKIALLEVSTSVMNSPFSPVRNSPP
jgi:hypothetical protein